MTEFEIQQLLIQSRWEFDVATYLFIFSSLSFMAIGTGLKVFHDSLNNKVLQLSYLIVSLFFMIRAYAAIIRGQKLGGLLVEMDPVFEFWNPALQSPTWYIRWATFLIVLITIVLVLNRQKHN